jgi:SPP1 gp7 family putative phage head morphogenesis protein
MKEKQLQPIRTPIKFDEEVEADILSFLFEALFAPIIELMKKTQESIFTNASSSAIASGIRTGKIQFSDGIIKGDFNAAMTKEFRSLGIKFDKRIKGYRKSLNNLPISTQVAIGQTASKYEQLATNMIGAIDNINYDEELGGLSFTKTFDKIVDDVDVDFTKTVTKKIGIKVDITEGQRAAITEGFSNNLKLFIKDFADEQTLLLRQDVEKAVFAGIRAESLQKVIRDRFGVSESKAKFLAKQEINLLTSKYKQAKYQDAGLNKYRWSISNVRTRPDHRDLNGKIFFYDDPPITNQETGARNNPLEDFGCNCIDIPIIEV